MEDAFNTLGFYVPILAFKILIMSPITSSARYREGSLCSPEDAKFRLGTTEAAKVKLALEDNPEVERIRRAHRNDLEAIVNFILVMIFFIVSGAEATTVRKTMLMYTGSLFSQTYLILTKFSCAMSAHCVLHKSNSSAIKGAL